jgi:hypothetical protein
MGIILILLTLQSISLIPGIYKIKIHQSSLRDSIRETIYYFKRKYALWQIIFPTAVLILIYNVGLIVDYDPAGYRVYNYDVFVITMAGVYLFTYIIFRFTRTMFVADLENCLKNLDSIDYTAIQKNIRRSRLVILAVAIGLLILALGGLFMFLQSAGRI